MTLLLGNYIMFSKKQKTPAKLKNQFCEVFVYLKMKKDELTEKLKAH